MKLILINIQYNCSMSIKSAEYYIEQEQSNPLNQTSSTITSGSDDPSQGDWTDDIYKADFKMKSGNSNRGKVHLMVQNGINLKGKCSNTKCQANKIVWIKLGYGKLDIAQSSYHHLCPLCFSKIQGKTITQIGYLRTKAEFRGVKYREDYQNHIKEVKTETTGEFKTFKLVEDSQLKWAYLFINAEKI